MLLPYGGMTRIRFEGFFSLHVCDFSRMQTPSNSTEITRK